jgi:hypothetical protein
VTKIIHPMARDSGCINTIKENAMTLLYFTKEVGIEVRIEINEYKFMFLPGFRIEP